MIDEPIRHHTSRIDCLEDSGSELFLSVQCHHVVLIIMVMSGLCLRLFVGFPLLPQHCWVVECLVSKAMMSVED